MVEPIYQIERVNQSFGEDKYQSVENLVIQTRAFVNRVPEIGVISFGAIPKNQTKQINLGKKGILSSIMLRSVYAFTGESLDDEITFNIFHKFDDGTEIRVATERFKSNDMPYEFPYGAILTPSNTIEIRANRQPIDNCFIYLQPVTELFRISAD